MRHRPGDPLVNRWLSGAGCEPSMTDTVVSSEDTVYVRHPVAVSNIPVGHRIAIQGGGG